MSSVTVRESLPAEIGLPDADPVPCPSDGSLDGAALASLQRQLARIEAKLDRLLTAQAQTLATQTRTAFSVEEVAEMLGKTPFTVREWCRLGRINASKRKQKQGRTEIWSIAAGEIERIRNEGLLPVDPDRNAV